VVWQYPMVGDQQLLCKSAHPLLLLLLLLLLPAL
jgi:hypothetical protein